MARLAATISIAAALLATPAWAQTDAMPATPEGAPGAATPQQPNQQDRLFAHMAAIGGMAEVEFGRLAAQKAESEAVKEFGQRMVDDHTKANERLSALAEQDGIPLPQALDDEHKAMLDHLDGLSGAQFDRAYIQGQVYDHQTVAQLLEWELGAGQDAEIKAFASETLPTVLEHLRMAQDVAAELSD